jgi:hypothetical protein
VVSDASASGLATDAPVDAVASIVLGGAKAASGEGLSLIAQPATPKLARAIADRRIGNLMSRRRGERSSLSFHGACRMALSGKTPHSFP